MSNIEERVKKIVIEQLGVKEEEVELVACAYNLAGGLAMLPCAWPTNLFLPFLLLFLFLWFLEYLVCRGGLSLSAGRFRGRPPGFFHPCLVHFFVFVLPFGSGFVLTRDFPKMRGRFIFGNSLKP